MSKKPELGRLVSPSLSSEEKSGRDLVLKLAQTYRLYRQMTAYPHLIPDMRNLFLEALAQRGVVTREVIEVEARDLLTQAGLKPEGKILKEYVETLTDLYFAENFTPEEIENYINLARKKQSFQELHRVVNTEGVTSKRIKKALKDFCQIPQGDLFLDPTETEVVRVALINHFISDQLPFIGIAKHHLTIRDIDEMLDHSYWDRRRPGKIGGKAAGMLLANKIILPRLQKRDPDLEKHVAEIESWYFNSGIFSDFVDYNELYCLHSRKYKSRDELESEFDALGPILERAQFPQDVVDDFREFLAQVGEAPLILRSSSLLEDNFGYSFSGKYESFFLANQGDLETRLQEFVAGLKYVLMSTWAPGPIIYRRDHNLIDFDERMSVLVQKVVGRRFGDYFFPFCAGVAFSRNVYNWSPRLDPQAGLVRLVFGLGTRAVDRIAGDYTRMVGLSHPSLRPEIDPAQIKKYSQKNVDLINLRTRRKESVPARELFKQIDHPDLFYAVSLDEEGHLAPPRFKGEKIDPLRTCLTFDNLLTQTPFVHSMKKILRRLEEAYGRPVDVEFAWDDGKLYILQCRSLSLREDVGKVHLPEDVPEEQIVFTNDQSVISGVVEDIEYIVYVDPKAYARLQTYEDKTAVGRAVGRLNRLLEKKRYVLFGPGRWGSNDINLGVRVGYEDINHTLILAEIAFEEKGSTPEVSHGTHFFSDLVEARIIPLALYPDIPQTVFKEDFFLQAPNQLEAMLPDLAHLAEVIKVIHVPEWLGGRMFHVYQDGEDQQGLALVGPSKSQAGQSS